VEVLNPARSTARHPLFQVGLSFQNLDTFEFELPGLAVSAVDADAEVAQFDLHLIVSDQYDDNGDPTGIGGTLKYSRALFDESSARKIVDGNVLVAVDVYTRDGEPARLDVSVY